MYYYVDSNKMIIIVVKYEKRETVIWPYGRSGCESSMKLGHGNI